LALVVPLLKPSVPPPAAALMGTVAGEPARAAVQRCWGETATTPTWMMVVLGGGECTFLERKPMRSSASVLWHVMEFRWVPFLGFLSPRL